MVQDDPDETLPANHKDYPDGSLLRVVFHNFLTYEHTSFVPTAHLNMILGHNGSGKSSIICGICLACGGSPKSLGRSEKIAEYVRHGCQEGYVEIAIADLLKGPQVVRLTIRVGKAPEYRLNGDVTTQAELVKLRKHYNIQIDNPCAFLAQDKVKSFSEQSSIELLRNTEKAASDDLAKKHDELVEQRTDSTSIEDKCTSSDKTVKRIENEITKLEPFVENYRKKQQLAGKLRLLERKSSILEFDRADADYRMELKKMDTAMGEYKELEREINKGEGRINELQDKARNHKKNVQKLKSESERIHIDLEHSMDKKRMQRAVEKAKEKLDFAKASSDKHEKRLEENSNQIEAAKGKLAQAKEDLEGYEKFVRKMHASDRNFEKVREAIRNDEDGISKLTYQMNALEGKQREQMGEARDNIHQRLRALQAFSKDACKAWDHYDRNRHKFRGKIFTPFMDITLKYKEAAKALENSVSMRDRSIIICQFKEDEELINGRDATWNINTTVVSKQDICEDEVRGGLPSELKQLGFKFTILDSFDAPDELKQYLANVSGLSTIAWGGAEVEKNIGEVANRLTSTRYKVFLTETMRCQCSRSKYSNELIQSQSAMRDARTFREMCLTKSPTVNTDDGENRRQAEELRAKINTSRRELDAKKMEVQKERDVMKAEQLSWKSKNQVKMRWERELAMLERTQEQLERENFNVDAAERDLEKIRSAERLATIKMFEEGVQMQERLKTKNREMAISAFIENVLKQKSNEITLGLGDSREKLNGLKDMKQHVEQELKQSMNKRKAASDAMKSACQLTHLDENKMDDREKRIFAKLNKMFEEGNVPTNLLDLEHEINCERTRLKVAEEQGEDGSIEHEQRSEQLKKELVVEQNKLEKLVENRTRLHETLGTNIDTWRVEVETMIGRINENYEKYFRSLGCRGEVSIEIPDNPLDIEKYGIMIMVCFRAGEKMKRLDNRVQSGGERSVATMLYLLALQQLCPVPFRCIDEINQGMDPTNERKVFDIMVGLWNGADGALTKTQYFLLSPKLLHGLDMRENVNIVMVNSTLADYHGKIFDTASKLDISLAQLELNA